MAQRKPRNVKPVEDESNVAVVDGEPEWDQEEAPLKLVKVTRYDYTGNRYVDDVPEISIERCPQCGRNVYAPEAQQHRNYQHGG